MLPKNISSYGHLVDNLINVINAIIIVLTALSFSVIIYSVIKYRKSKNPKATYKLGRFIAKIVLLDFVMIVFDVVIAVYSVYGWTITVMQDHEELKKQYKEYVEVDVTGRQFFWSFTHSGADNKLNTNDDFTLGNYLVVPVDTLVLINLTSQDVIHSLFIPNVRLKYDAVPGRTFETWFIAKETGTYPIWCAELCGAEHYNMRARLKVLSKQEYKEWIEKKSHENEYASAALSTHGNYDTTLVLCSSHYPEQRAGKGGNNQ